LVHLSLRGLVIRTGWGIGGQAVLVSERAQGVVCEKEEVFHVLVCEASGSDFTGVMHGSDLEALLCFPRLMKKLFRIG